MDPYPGRGTPPRTPPERVAAGALGVHCPGPQPEGAIRGRMARMRAGQEESLDRDGRQWNCSSYPDPEEEDRAAPQGPSLRDT
jgi:hypothetical protein